MHARLFLSSCFCAVFATAAIAADNTFENFKPVPPPGIAISESDRLELEKGAAELGKEIDSLRTELAGKPVLLDLLPDAQIYHKAVDWALRYNEFYRSNEVQIARHLLTQGMARVKPWRLALAK